MICFNWQHQQHNLQGKLAGLDWHTTHSGCMARKSVKSTIMNLSLLPWQEFYFLPTLWPDSHWTTLSGGRSSWKQTGHSGPLMADRFTSLILASSFSSAFEIADFTLSSLLKTSSSNLLSMSPSFALMLRTSVFTLFKASVLGWEERFFSLWSTWDISNLILFSQLANSSFKSDFKSPRLSPPSSSSDFPSQLH